MQLETMTKNQAGRMPCTRFCLLLVAQFPDVCRAWRVCAYVSTCAFWRECETERDGMNIKKVHLRHTSMSIRYVSVCVRVCTHVSVCCKHVFQHKKVCRVRLRKNWSLARSTLWRATFGLQEHVRHHGHSYVNKFVLHKHRVRASCFVPKYVFES